MPMWFSSVYSLQSGIGSFAHAISNPTNIPAPTITATASPAMRFSFLFSTVRITKETEEFLHSSGKMQYIFHF